MSLSKGNKILIFVGAPVQILALFFMLLPIPFERNLQIISFSPISDPLVNPLMGWAPWATLEYSEQPHTLVYADLTWRDFEPQQGFFDFDSFESKNQLDRWRREGKRVVFRFVADVPGDDYHLDIPDWLFEAMNGDGDYYDNDYGKGFSPTYSNPVFIQNHKLAIEALGRRYGNDDFFAYIELGSLGHWGEWHISSELGKFPKENVRELIVTHYVSAFPKTHLLMRRPFSIARILNLGLYNDMTGDPESTSTWLDWIEYGGGFSVTEENDALDPIPDGWQTAPIGGEQAPSISDQVFYRENLKQTLDLLRKSHASFIGPNGPYRLEHGGIFQNGIDQILSVLGYRIYVKQIQMPRWVILKRKIHIQLSFANDGIAPIYYNWPINLYLLDEYGEVITISQIDMDIRKVMPGESYRVSTNVPLTGFKSGSYSLGIAVVDPQTQQPAVQLAMEKNRADMIYEIGVFEFIRVFNMPSE